MIRGRYSQRTVGPASLPAIGGFCHLLENEEVVKAPATSDKSGTAFCHRCTASARPLRQYILTTTLLMMFAASSTRSALLLKCR